ncbi:MAG: glycosyltransferase family 8 protein [Lachnospiraceae bacterium]|nr:glycosyltransferase family 8 protein [Lachnospiraceae bacterium]
MRHIPVVFATDNNYKFFLITLTSLVSHAASDTFYDIYILVDNDFLAESEQEIREYLKNKSHNCDLKFINVGNIFNDVTMQLKTVTRPTFFRLLAPQLLSEDRCIYLDTDVVVLADLQELYDFSLADNYVAGVKAPGYILMSFKEEYCKQALLPDLDQYINAGVLLMNLDKMRQDEVVVQFLNRLPMNMEFQDQDIINSVCYGKIKFLQFKYNVMSKYAHWSVKDYNGIYSETELRSAWNEPKIIHYADRFKPWKNLNCALGEFWWDICKRTSLWEYFYNNLQNEFFSKAIYQSPGSTITTKKVAKLFDIAFDRKYVIYGAKDKARDLVAYMIEKEINIEFIVVSEMTDNPLEIEGIKVIDLLEAQDKMYDKTILIATRERFHTDIISNLLKYKYKECIPISDEWKASES